MPKPVRRKEITMSSLPEEWKREARQPQKDEDIFTPGYYCPECHLRIDSNDLRLSSRPKIWHESCKPPQNTPARRKRICPGCGKHRQIPFGKSSAYCDDGCKLVYMAYFAEKSGRKCFCGEPVYLKDKQSRRMKLCHQHGFQYGTIHAMRPDTLGHFIEPHRIILEIKRLHVNEHACKILSPAAIASLRSAEKVYPNRTWLIPGETELPSQEEEPLPKSPYEEEEDPFAP